MTAADTIRLASSIAAVLMPLMAFFYVWARAQRGGLGKMAWVDLGWGLGMTLVPFVLWLGGVAGVQGLLVGIPAVFWASRLSIHIGRRVRKLDEDGRYVDMRSALGGRANLGFLFLFIAQGFLVGVFALPLIAAMSAPFVPALYIAGVVVFVTAVGGEAVADAQLARHLRDPETKDEICQSGLWRWSRHPNYFFEWLHWLAYVVWSAAGELWAFSFVGPVVMYIFLRYITGIPHIERRALQKRGDAWLTYQQTTSEFWPWIPRKHS